MILEGQKRSTLDLIIPQKGVFDGKVSLSRVEVLFWWLILINKFDQ